MIYTLDTEFIESGPYRPIQLISIGLVCENGRELYLESNEFNSSDASDWVKLNVIGFLDDSGRSLKEIKELILSFIGRDKPEFWGYYADYDWVVFCQIFGSMMDLPKDWPMYCNDIKQLCKSRGNPKLPKQKTPEHNALNDAIWNMEQLRFLNAIN